MNQPTLWVLAVLAWVMAIFGILDGTLSVVIFYTLAGFVCVYFIRKRSKKRNNKQK